MQSSTPRTLLTMQGPPQVQVPRRGQPTSGFIHQSNTYPDTINAWLRQDETEVPWHNLASIVVPSTSQNASHSGSATLPSDNAATRGSSRRDDSVAGMTATHVQGQATLSPSTFRRVRYADPLQIPACPTSTRIPSRSRYQPTTNLKSPNTNQGPQTDKDVL